MSIQEQRYDEYQEFLAFQRGKIVDPLGELAVASFGAPLGIDVPRFESVEQKSAPVASLEQKRALAAPVLRQEMRIQPAPLNTPEVYLGYAA